MTVSGPSVLEPRGGRPFAAPIDVWWAHGERVVRLTGLRGGIAWRARAGLLVCLAAAVLIVMLAVDVDLPGGHVHLGEWGDLPRALVGAGIAMFAIVQLIVARVALLSPRFSGTLVRLYCSAVAAALGAGFVSAARDLEQIRESRTIFVRRGGALIQAAPYEAANTTFVATAGWVMVACAAGLLLGRAELVRRPWLAESLAAGPWVLALAGFLFVDRARVPAEVLAGTDWPPSAQAAAGLAAVDVWVSLAPCLALIFLWQALTAARAGADVGVGVVRVGKRLPHVLATALVLKLAWVSLGYAGALPAVLGGATKTWADSRSNGVVAWTLAVGFVGVAALLLLNADVTRRSTEHAFSFARWFLTTGFMFMWIAASVCLLLTLSLGAWPWGRQALERGASWFADNAVWAGVATIAIAVVLALLAVSRRSRPTALTIFLAALGAWAGPRALAIAVDPADPWDSAFVELVTLDTVVTIVVASLALRTWSRPLSGHAKETQESMLLLALGAFTVLCYSDLLFEASPTGTRGVAFALGLIVPAAYLFLADAGALNRVRPQRERILLSTIAAAASLLFLAALYIGLGQLQAETPTFENVGREVAVVPLALVLLAGARSIAGPRVKHEAVS